MKNIILIRTLTLAGYLLINTNAHAEVVGRSVIGVSVTEISTIKTGWSAKNSLLGKPVYNELGDKIGSVDDLIIAPDKSLSYAIIGAGGFLGMGKHDVAIPITQINEINGKMELKGATKESIKQMPKFEYASNNNTSTSSRDAFINTAERDIQKGKDKLAELNKKMLSEKTEIKAKVKSEIVAMQQHIKNAEAKLAELKNATEKK